MTKTFEIEKCDALENQENKGAKKTDGYEFIDELERERKKVQFMRNVFVTKKLTFFFLQKRKLQKKEEF